MNKLVEALPDNIVAERHEVTGKWVLWYLTDEQATKAMRVLAEHRAEPSADVVERVAIKVQDEMQFVLPTVHESKLWDVSVRIAKAAIAAMQKQ